MTPFKNYKKIRELVSDNYVSLQTMSPGDDFPWLRCNQTWNTKNCHPFLENFTEDGTGNFENSLLLVKKDEFVHMPGHNSYREFFSSTHDIHLRTVFAHLLVWVFVLVPLVKGPASLFRSFYVCLPTALFLNASLFFRGISLSGTQSGVKEFLRGGSNNYFIGSVAYSVFGDRQFPGNSGFLFMMGKFIGDKEFVFPKVFVTFATIFTLMTIDVLKMAGFRGHFQGLFHEDSAQIKKSLEDEHRDVAIGLTQIPGATFWLIAHYSHLLCLRLPSISFALESVASSLAESLPCHLFPQFKVLTTRSKFPQNLIIPGTLVIVGFVVSMVVGTQNGDDLFDSTIRYSIIPLWVFYLSVMCLILGIILPLSFTKRFNHGHLDFLTFISRHDQRSKIVNIVSVVIGMVWTLMLLCAVVRTVTLQLFGYYSGDSLILVYVVLALFIVGVAWQFIMHRRNPNAYPWYSPLGRKLDAATLVDGINL